MAENYFAECSCGQKIRVELFEAGAEKVCPSCKSIVVVPNTNTLKESTGDQYPSLRPIEKIRKTLESHEPPFSGLCHGCGTEHATHQIPITLVGLVERYVPDEGGIRPTITGGVKLVAGKSEEIWQTTEFPLLLCNECHAVFQRSQSRAKISSRIKAISLVILLIGFLCLAYFNLELVAALAGLFWLVGVVAWIVSVRGKNDVDPFVLEWLNKIRWVPEAIQSEAEYKLLVGQPQSAQQGKS